MSLAINQVVQGKTEHESIVAMAKAAAAIAALECADDPYEFGRIQRAILTAMQQSFPEVFDFKVEEVS